MASVAMNMAMGRSSYVRRPTLASRIAAEEARSRTYPSIHSGSDLPVTARGAFLQTLADPQWFRIHEAGEEIDPSWHYLMITGSGRLAGSEVRVLVHLVPPSGVIEATLVWDGSGWAAVTEPVGDLRLDCGLPGARPAEGALLKA